MAPRNLYFSKYLTITQFLKNDHFNQFLSNINDLGQVCNKNYVTENSQWEATASCTMMMPSIMCC